MYIFQNLTLEQLEENSQIKVEAGKMENRLEEQSAEQLHEIEVKMEVKDERM